MKYTAAILLLCASCSTMQSDTGFTKRKGADLLRQWELGAQQMGSLSVSGRMITGDEREYELHGRFGAGRYLLDQEDVHADSITHALGMADAQDLFGIALVVDAREFISESDDGIQTWQYTADPDYTYRVKFSGRPLRMISREVFDATGRLRTRFQYEDFDGITPDIAFPRVIRVTSPTGENLLTIRADKIASQPPLAAPRRRPRPSRVDAPDKAAAPVRDKAAVPDRVKATETAGDPVAFNELWRAWSEARPASPDDLTREESIRFSNATAELVQSVYRSHPEQANSILIQSIALAPSNSLLAGLAVRLAQMTGDTAEALRAVRRYADAVPADTTAWLAIGAMLEEMERLDEAEEFYDSMTRIFPDEPDFRFNLGSLFFHRDKWVEGEEVFDGLAAWLDTAGISSSTKAGLANAMASVYAEANIALEKARRLNSYALSENPDDPFFLDTLGVLLWREGRKPAALTAFQRALDQNEHPMIRGHMERAMGRR